ncbi:TetR/AcrR family transcriptional regulator [Undibacterium sp. Jales W-56]|uniref:TetR/AcrR family transcriptional regulator n=1 Tax=Undibacterium sp. Jales W-56 TaxID=2897325 RepID=UPI0021CEAFD5|nr:TetR/AcrR family transcriptional regulator [Undibacterium sp. Jales W-56]MCU6435176.1 TetR/AcrR family transcriptional regulator [Undibacterium sp. Jales W-56]
MPEQFTVLAASPDESGRYKPPVVAYVVRGYVWDRLDPALPKFDKMHQCEIQHVWHIIILVQSVQNILKAHMARHLEFDRIQAVALAADAFWREGYEPLPALELAEAMGVAKSSLYNTFGSKRELFIQAVAHYSEQQRTYVLTLAKSTDIVGRLREMLLEIIGNNDAGRGCLLVNTATELGLRDKEVRQHVKTGFDGMERAFEALIYAGQRSGNISSNINPQQYAIILVAGIAGLRVLAKGGFSEDQLLPVVETLLAGLSE